MAIQSPQGFKLIPPPSGNTAIVPSQATSMDGGIGGCAPCSGVPSYNSQLQPNCDFIPMNPPNPTPTTTIPSQNLRLPLPANQNQQTKGPPDAGEISNRVQPSQRGGGKPDIRRNPLFNQRPTVNPQSRYWYQNNTRNICQPIIRRLTDIPTPTPPQQRQPRVTKPTSNGTNPCNTGCGPHAATNQGEQWNNRGSQILPMQTMLYPVSMPPPRMNISPGNTDQPILQSGLQRSSVTPDDICVNTDTQAGSQPAMRPIPPSVYMPPEGGQNLFLTGGF